MSAPVLPTAGQAYFGPTVIWICLMEYLLALNQGTSSSYVIVFNRADQIAASAQQELPQYLPQPGWAEHDPFDI